MSQHDDRLPVEHMLNASREAIDLLRGVSAENLAQNRTLQLALLQLVTIVGEAARRVSRESQARFPEIPWREAITTRNRVTHGYDTIDYSLIWNTITIDFPPLVTALERARASLGG
jgi:uncharacterized protein with HEPN domain